MKRKGHTAPEFTLPDMTGKARSLRGLLERGPVLLAFYKTSCPTCQYTFPFLERMKDSAIQVVGISQDPRRGTEQFNREFGVTFPVLLDPADDGYVVSNSYEITHVPTLVLVEPDGRISLASNGFVKADLEEAARRAGRTPLWMPDEKVPAFRAG